MLYCVNARCKKGQFDANKEEQYFIDIYALINALIIKCHTLKVLSELHFIWFVSEKKSS